MGCVWAGVFWSAGIEFCGLVDGEAKVRKFDRPSIAEGGPLQRLSGVLAGMGGAVSGSTQPTGCRAPPDAK